MNASKTNNQFDNPMISLKTVDFAYANKKLLLHNFSLKLQGKGIFSIIGPSGIGKSTLLKLIGGLIQPQKGYLELYPEQPRISLVSQYPTLLPFKTVRQSLKIPAKLFNDKNIYRYAENLAFQFGLGDSLDSFPSQLSGGMKSRVSLIKAVSVNPNFLLLDEPFASLDEINKNIIIRFLKQLINEQNILVILVTHNIMDTLFFSDKIYLFLSQPIEKLYEYSISTNKESSYQEIVELLEKNW